MPRFSSIIHVPSWQPRSLIGTTGLRNQDNGRGTDGSQESASGLSSMQDRQKTLRQASSYLLSMQKVRYPLQDTSIGCMVADSFNRRVRLSRACQYESAALLPCADAAPSIARGSCDTAISASSKPCTTCKLHQRECDRAIPSCLQCLEWVKPPSLL